MEPEQVRAPEVTFPVGEMAVHPAHGVGEVLGIELREFGGKKSPFFVLKIVETGLKVLVATSAIASVGLRRVMDQTEANSVLEILRAHEVAVDVQPWSRRQRIYAEMLRSGSPGEIAKVLRDLVRLRLDKNLSFGERRLLDQAKGLLVHELALAKHVERGAIELELQTIFAA